MNGRRFGRKLATAAKSGVVHGQTHQVELVFAVEDREIRFVTQQSGRTAQQTVADVVKRARPDS